MGDSGTWNTFGEHVANHVEAIETVYESYLAAFSSVQKYLRKKDLSNQPVKPTSKRFMHLTMTPYCKQRWNELIPAEYAVVVFSFDKGVEASMVGLIDPEVIPLGERGEVMTNCRKNAFPIPGQFDGLDAKPTPSKTVLKLIEGAAKKWGCYMEDEILIFAMRAEVAILRGCIRWLEVQNPDEKWGKYRIVSLEMLLMALSELVQDAGNNEAVIRHEGGAAKYLYHTRYEFSPLLACHWHQKEDNVGKVPYCALNIVLRRAYNALHYLCHLFGRKLAQPSHLPPETEGTIHRELKKEYDTLMNMQPLVSKHEGKSMVKHTLDDNVVMFKVAEMCVESAAN